MSIYEFHYIGGMPWMVLLSLLLLVITALIVLAIVRGPGNQEKFITAIKQISGFALAFGAFSTLVAFYRAFSDLEQMEVQFVNIMGGLKVALITTLYGFGIFLFGQAAVIILKFARTNK